MALLGLLMLAVPAAGQYQTPTVDGVIQSGEYGNSGGDWSMTWDADHLYVARSNVAAGNGIAVYLDLDPLPTPTGGSDADGNTSNASEMWGGSIMPYSTRLPFRADIRVLAGSGSLNMQVASGTGTWTFVAAPGMAATFVGGVGEIRIPWAEMGVPGLTAPPPSFQWLGYELTEGGGPVSETLNQAPPANPDNGGQLPYAFVVSSTADGSSTNPFSDRQSTWRILDPADSGAYTLRDAIVNVNADTASSQRFITFDSLSFQPLLGPISLLSELPAITQQVTIDGRTHPGYLTTPPFAPGASISIGGGGPFHGLRLSGASDSVVRALRLHGFDRAIVVSGGEGNTVAGNWIGVDLPNQTGIRLEGGIDATIGGIAAADRNVVSGNTVRGIDLDGTTGTLVASNYIGTDSGGTIAVANGTGIHVSSSTGTVIGGAAIGNVISGNLGHGILADTNDLTILGNKIGVGASGFSILGNGSDGINGTSNLTIGSIAVPNTIANNSRGISAQSGNLFIRGNSVFANSTAAVAVSGGITPPAINASAVNGEVLTVNFSVDATATTPATQSLQLDLYDASPAPFPEMVQYRATSPCYSGDSLTEVGWTVGAPFLSGAFLTVMATAYEDGACSDPGTGTSNPAAVFQPGTPAISSVALAASTATAWGGEAVTFTATVTSSVGFIGGTVEFSEADVPLAGCEAVPVVSGQAVCVAGFSSDGVHPVFATYSGDGIHYFSSSNMVEVTVSTHLFTGPGNFTDTSKWSSSVLPAEGEHFVVTGECTFDLSAPGTAYGKMMLDDGSVVWADDHGVPLTVTDVRGTGTALVDMSVGGLIEVRGVWHVNEVAFEPGNGTVRLSGDSQPLPVMSYNALLIAGDVTMSEGPVTIHGDLVVLSEASLTATAGAVVFDSVGSHTLGNQGVLSLFDLEVSADVSLGAIHSFSVSGTLTVDGDFNPAAGAVISGGMLTGGGLVRVTGIAAPGSFGTQYAMTKTLTNLTVQFSGTSGQSIDALTYQHLILNNTAGASLANGDTRVTGSLGLEAGILHIPSTAGLIIENSSPSAVSTGSGWFTGQNFRWLAGSGTNSYSFPAGIGAGPAPITLMLHGVPTPGYVHAGAAMPGVFSIDGSGIDPARDANVVWVMNLEVAPAAAGLTFEYGMLADPGADPSRFVLRMRPFSGAWSGLAAVPAAGSLAATGISLPNNSLLFAAGNQLIDHYEVDAASPQYRDTPFTVTVTAMDVLDLQVDDSTTIVTLSSSSGNVEYNANFDGTFGDGSKALSGGQLTMHARGTAVETATLLATDPNAKSGSSDAVTFLEPAPFGPPPNFSATAIGTGSVQLTWSAVVGAIEYEVFRGPNTGSMSLFNDTAGTSLADNGVSPNTTYVYQVRAVNSGGPSGLSAPDLATTIVFTDPVLSGVAVKAVHITQLRTAIEAIMQAATGSSSFIWTDAIQPGTQVRAVHLSELRGNLNLARTLLGVPQVSFTDAPITAGATIIKGVHITEIRAATQ